MLRIVVSLVAVVAIIALARPAFAVKKFYDQFVAVYVEGNENEEFATLVTDEAKCYVCHQGKRKKNRNAYGKALNEFLHKRDAKDTEKIVEALNKVAEMHSVADDESSPTFGELIAEGKLPGGDLEEVKKEPEGSGSKEGSSKKD